MVRHPGFWWYAMPDAPPYGTRFISHLKSISRRSHFDYADLQAIKAMAQGDLARTLLPKCPEFAQIVLDHSPEDAAELYNNRIDEESKARHQTGMGIANTASGLIDAIACLFSASG